MNTSIRPADVRPVGMYSSCLFCHADLGRNEVIEHFPLGRRLAFDAARGRLWVVCIRCKGWNLTPLEERWEAIEDCERRFRDTRLRVSTDQIGLAKLREGLELVRVGDPQRPEFAAWRYGERLVLRRRRTLIQVGAGLTVLGGIVGGGLAVGVGFMGVYWGGKGILEAIVKGSPGKIIARIDTGDGEQATVRRKHLADARLVTVADGWELRVPGRTGKGARGKRMLTLRGSEALDVATRILPAVNRFGGSTTDVQDAVRLMEDEPDPLRLFARLSRQAVGPLSTFAPEIRLAMEMAAHEQNERMALEGELTALEAAWRDAEEIAAISDNMFLPAPINEWMDRLRGR